MEALAQERRGRLQNAVEAIVALLAAEPGITKVILFGSAARGEVGPASDIDVAVTGLKPEEFMPTWLKVERVANDIPFDLVCLEEAPVALREAIEAEGVIAFQREA